MVSPSILAMPVVQLAGRRVGAPAQGTARRAEVGLAGLVLYHKGALGYSRC